MYVAIVCIFHRIVIVLTQLKTDSCMLHFTSSIHQLRNKYGLREEQGQCCLMEATLVCHMYAVSLFWEIQIVF